MKTIQYIYVYVHAYNVYVCVYVTLVHLLIAKLLKSDILFRQVFDYICFLAAYGEL